MKKLAFLILLGMGVSQAMAQTNAESYINSNGKQYYNPEAINGGLLSSNEVSDKAEVAVYPNPATSGFVKLDLSDVDFALGATVQIFNLTGQIVLEKPILEASVMNLDVSFLPKGTYVIYVPVEHNGKRVQEKLSIL